MDDETQLLVRGSIVRRFEQFRVAGSRFRVELSPTHAHHRQRAKHFTKYYLHLLDRSGMPWCCVTGRGEWQAIQFARRDIDHMVRRNAKYGKQEDWEDVQRFLEQWIQLWCSE